MLSALFIVLPIFALIFIGWLAGWRGMLGPAASAEISRFVVLLALPALLFNVVAGARSEDLWQPRYIAAFTLASLLCMGLAVTVAMRRHGRLADAAIEGLNAAYPNIGYVGIPLSVMTFGQPGLLPASIGAILTMCVTFAAAIVLVEIALHRDVPPRLVVLKVAGRLARNPILIAPVIAAPFPLLGISVPVPVDTTLKLLGAAASPCALVALGLFFAARRPSLDQGHGFTAFLVAVKLLLHPALAWVLGTYVVGLPALWTNALVLMSALPSGTGSFMLAELYGRDATVSSRTIVITTLLSILSLAAIVGAVG